MAKMNIGSLVELNAFILSLRGNSNHVGYVTWLSDGANSFNAFPTGGSRKAEFRNPLEGRVSIVKRWQFRLSPYTPVPERERKQFPKRPAWSTREGDFATRHNGTGELYLLVDPQSRVLTGDDGDQILIDGRPATEGELAILSQYKKPPKEGEMEALTVKVSSILDFAAEGGKFVRS